MISKKDIQLIQQYFEGETSDEEDQEIAQRKKNEPIFAQKMEEYRKYKLLIQEAEIALFEEEDFFEEIKSEQKPENKKPILTEIKTKKSIFNFVNIAVSVLILVCLGTFLWYFLKNESPINKEKIIVDKGNKKDFLDKNVVENKKIEENKIKENKFLDKDSTQKANLLVLEQKRKDSTQKAEFIIAINANKQLSDTLKKALLTTKNKEFKKQDLEKFYTNEALIDNQSRGGNDDFLLKTPKNKSIFNFGKDIIFNWSKNTKYNGAKFILNIKNHKETLIFENKNIPAENNSYTWKNQNKANIGIFFYEIVFDGEILANGYFYIIP